MTNALIINAHCPRSFSSGSLNGSGFRSVDDLFFPMHMSFRFFGMEPLETFACFDVLKNPNIESDFERFDAHIAQQF